MKKNGRYKEGQAVQEVLHPFLNVLLYLHSMVMLPNVYIRSRTCHSLLKLEGWGYILLFLHVVYKRYWQRSKHKQPRESNESTGSPQDIIHRDIKPENIVVSMDNTIKVAGNENSE